MFGLAAGERPGDSELPRLHDLPNAEASGGRGDRKTLILHGFVGFSDDDKLDPNAPWKRPLQRYMWWDYLVDPGDEVQYSIDPGRWTRQGPSDALAG